MRRQQVRVVGRGRNTTLRLVGGDRDGEPLDGLCESARTARALEKLQRQLVQRARADGRSWTEIGAALGISKQSAWQRFATTED